MKEYLSLKYWKASSLEGSVKKQVLLTAAAGIALILVLGGVKGVQIFRAITQHAYTPPPEAVTAIEAKEAVWPKTLSAVGTLVPHQGVTLSAEESGKIAKISFESGSAVEEGAVLVELDTTVEEANLKGAVAREALARRSYDRIKKLRETNSMSQDDFDNASSKLQQAEADVQSLQGLISRKHITAPFSGQTGIRMVNVGQFVSPGTPIVPLHSLEPMYFDFFLPQQNVSSLAVGQKVKLSVDAYPTDQFEGVVSAVNPQVDQATRNVEVRATIPNPEGKLRAGMFAKVSVVLPSNENVITVPSTSINFAPYGDSVWIIEKMKDPSEKEYLGVRQQVVRLGEKRGDQISVVEGLKAGEQVVTSGLFKLRAGVAVSINDKFAPENSLEPNPSDT